uniref:Uncharacterized protein n=1 Tax=Trypanosoma congolense (strain IL3000) TaxID=1068625 RepID=G0UT60_TRYCI|nr:hypothetical protein, unlikely [Trypanosoma congolense IL3000]
MEQLTPFHPHCVPVRPRCCAAHTHTRAPQLRGAPGVLKRCPKHRHLPPAGAHVGTRSQRQARRPLREIVRGGRTPSVIHLCGWKDKCTLNCIWKCGGNDDNNNHHEKKEKQQLRKSFAVPCHIASSEEGEKNNEKVSDGVY